MKILVTGAGGFIGSGLVEKLVEYNDFQVLAVYSKKVINKNISKSKNYNVDIFDVNNPFEYFERPDIVVHCAWKDGFNHNSDEHLLNLNNHYRFLMNFINKSKKIIILGSMHEVGYYEGCITKDVSCNPLSLYGISKNALRQAIFLNVNKTETIINWLRGFYIVKDEDAGSSIFSKLIKAEKDGKSSFPFNSGKNKYDFIDYYDFIEQIITVIKKSDKSDVINCCSGHSETLASRVERFIKDNNLKIHLDYGAFPDRPYDSPEIYGDNSEIKRLLKNE